MHPTDPAPPESPEGTPSPDHADIERAKAVVRAALDMLAEDRGSEPPGRFAPLGKAVDYIIDRWVMFAFLATLAIALFTHVRRDDFSFSYFVDEVAFKQTELNFKKTEFSHKEKQFQLQQGKKIFEREQAEDQVTYAHSLLDVGRYAAAAKVFKAATELDPTNLNASRGLFNARIYQQVTKTPGQGAEYDPVVVYQRIEFLLSQKDNDPYALVARANMLLNTNLQAAEQDLDQAIRVRPKLAEAHRLLAEIYRRRKKLPRALAEVQKALKQSPWDVRYLEAEAQIYDARDDFENAAKSLKTAHQLDPDDISVLFATANLYLRHGHGRAADWQAALIARLENQAVVKLPKNAVPYRFSAGASHVWLYSVDEKRHYAYQNMALLAFILQRETERHLALMRRLELADRSHLKRLLYYHVKAFQAKSKASMRRRLEEIREQILQAIEAGEREARMRQIETNSTAGKPKTP